MIRLLIILFAFSIHIQCAAQDFIVTHSGDTIFGVIKILSFEQVDRIELLKSKKMIYSALQLRSMKFNNEIYKPVKHDNAIRFMKVVKDGYLSLLNYRIESQLTYNGTLLLKLDGRSIELPNLSFKKDMVSFLKDCPTVTEKIKNGDFKKRDLNRIIDAYNACLTRKDTSESSFVASNESSEKTNLVEALKKKIETAKLANTTDIVDLLNDINKKIIRKEAIPNYQIEALKGYLSGAPELTTELNQLILVIKEK